MTTKSISREEAEATRKWFVVDASGVTLGRLATEVAAVVRGKHKTTFTRHQDCGDCVIVLNASKVVVSGNKQADKQYHFFTGYVGHMKTKTAGELLEQNPELLIEEAVHGMLPKGPLGKEMRKNLRVFAGATHPHSAQNPQPLTLKYAKAAK